jgi:Ribosomal RNA-processing protein 7 (RRP7) C-terminal domain
MGKRRKLSSGTPAVGTAAAAPRIKNYLPVRIQWPDATTTFIYVKEHVATTSTASSTRLTATHTDATVSQHKQQQPTLFVANCPNVANIPTKRLLQAIFGQYGEVVRVTCIANPRSAANGGSGPLNGHCERVPWNATANLTTVSSHWTDNIAPPSYFQYNRDGPQFAHVVFATSKDLQQTLRALSHAMASSSSTSSTTTDPVIEISALELQTLRDDEDNADDDDNGRNTDTTSGILAVAARYRASLHSCSANDLMEECNRVVADHEEALAAAQKQRAMAASKPDEDGFVTVSYSNNTVGESAMNMNDNEENVEHVRASSASAKAAAASGRAGGRLRAVTALGRRRKKKTLGGAQPLPDFYRFQMRESKQKSVHELRRRFAQDVERVQRQKQQGKQL